MTTDQYISVLEVKTRSGSNNSILAIFHTALRYAVRVRAEEMFLEPAVLWVRAVDALVVVSFGTLTASVLAAGAVGSLAVQVIHASAAALGARPSVNVTVCVSQAHCNHRMPCLELIFFSI